MSLFANKITAVLAVGFSIFTAGLNTAIAAETCYWMDPGQGNIWVSAPQGNIEKHACFELDSCDGGEGKSQGGCYKWATGANDLRLPWHEPSTSAAGMPGALGTFDYKPSDSKDDSLSWWEDSDGVAPGTAGCHIGTDSNGTPNGRLFGEVCLSDTRLVESNPGVDVLHSHKGDIGHPDQFDCNAWCVGQGASKGTCVKAAAPPCEQSAKCECK